jgi:hypothetical protein
MGFAQQWGGLHGAAAFGVENGMRLAIPGMLGGSVYGGYRLGDYLSND